MLREGKSVSGADSLASRSAVLTLPCTAADHIERLLGQGTFGKVVSARCKQDNKRYAVKIMCVWYFHHCFV